MNCMQDPNMGAAMEKIAAILKEHDLMGAVLFAGKERSGFFHELSPSWSCARLEETAEGVELRITAKRENYQSAEEQKEHVTATINGLMGLLHVQKFVEQNLTGVLQVIGKNVDIHHVASAERIQSVRIRREGEG